jgi:hypothetical protein
MINHNLHQNPDSRNTQDTKIRYCIELTKEQWIRHWEMLLAGSAMADYLAAIWTTRASTQRFKLDPAAILTITGQGSHKIYSTHLSERWYELADPLGEIYDKAIKLTG